MPPPFVCTDLLRRLSGIAAARSRSACAHPFGRRTPTSVAGVELSRLDVTRAAVELKGRVRRTPLLDVVLAGRRVLLKCEQLQRSGSFKFRGAMLAASRSGTGEVVTASGGNHGLAIATACAELRRPAHIWVPSTSPADKVERIRRAGAEVQILDGDYQICADAAKQFAAANGFTYLPAYDHPDVVVGQGTCADEVLDDRPDCDAVVVSVGGGGLLTGTALAASGRAAVVGAEPTGIPTVTRALEAGRPVEVAIDSVTASALGARTTGELNVAVLREHPPRMELVSDEELLDARLQLWEEHRIAVEPASGAALAAVARLDAALPCVVLCGANSGWQATAS
jgi:threonine dehydratase